MSTFNVGRWAPMIFLAVARILEVDSIAMPKYWTRKLGLQQSLTIR